MSVTRATFGSIGFFENTMLIDNLAAVFKLIFLGGTALCLIFAMASRELAGYRFGEFAGLMLGATLGACLLVSSNNMAMFALGLETLSMCSYVLAGFVKHERAPAEAALKYVLYGAVASGVMLFGMGYLYGLGGTLELTACVGNLVSAGRMAEPAVLLALLLTLGGLGFKIAMVPFHFWCPDVYQGAPTPVTAFLSVGSKAAGFGALLRVTGPALMPTIAVDSLPMMNATPNFVAMYHGHMVLSIFFGLLAAVTMTWGNWSPFRRPMSSACWPIPRSRTPATCSWAWRCFRPKPSRRWRLTCWSTRR
jgi:NADH-quinone oxidoreductase subunit N